MLLIKIAGVGHVVVNIAEVETHLLSGILMEVEVDLHDTSVERSHLTLEDLTRFVEVAVFRLTLRNLGHDRHVGEIVLEESLDVLGIRDRLIVC